MLSVKQPVQISRLRFVWAPVIMQTEAAPYKTVSKPQKPLKKPEFHYLIYQAVSADIRITREIKKHVFIPVILTGGITSAAAAEELLENNSADLIGVGRALLKDSLWAEKAIHTLQSSMIN